MLGDRSSRPGLLGLALAFSMTGTSGCLGPNAFQFRGTNAAGFIKTVEESKDPNARYLAYDKLASSRSYQDEDQKDRAAELLTAKLKGGKEPIATRAVICRTLGMLGRPVARPVIVTATNDEDPLVRAEACRAMGRVGRPDDATILMRIMIIDPSFECKIAAIESLGELKSTDRRLYDLLLSGMIDDQPVIRVASLNALRKLTGQDLGVDVKAWQKYFDASSPKPADPATAPASSTPALPPLPETRNDLPPEIP